jgi:translation initiation factor 2 subunit 1
VSKRGRIKDVKKFMKTGNQEVMMVYKVDKDKGYIDLSKKQVQPDEAIEAEKKYKKSKMVHNILKEVAVKLNCKVQELYETFVWDLYEKYDHAYTAFKQIMVDQETVYSKLTNISEL